MNNLKNKQKLLKKGTTTKLAACENISIDNDGVVIAYENKEKLINALKLNNNLKGYIVKTYTINTTTEIKLKEE